MIVIAVIQYFNRSSAPGPGPLEQTRRRPTPQREPPPDPRGGRTRARCGFSVPAQPYTCSAAPFQLPLPLTWVLVVKHLCKCTQKIRTVRAFRDVKIFILQLQNLHFTKTKIKFRNLTQKCAFGS